MRALPIVLILASFALSACTPGERAPAAEPATPPGISLYQRMGGMKGIHDVIYEHCDMLLRDPRLKMNIALNNTFKKTDPDKMKASMTEWFCQKTGGPCIYPGRPLKDIHARMDISETDWGFMLETVRASLNKFKIGPREQKEFIELMESYRGDVITRKSN